MSKSRRVSLTPTAYTLRCGPDHEQYGDPYTMSAHVQRIGDDKVYIGAAAGEWGPYRREVLETLQEEGITTVEIERVTRDGSMRTKTIVLGED